MFEAVEISREITGSGQNLLNILPDTFQHLVKTSCYNTNLIFNNYRKLRYI